MSWIDKRAEFQKRFDELAQENIKGIITELNKSVGKYISSGGLSQDANNNAEYNKIIQLIQQGESIKKRYTALNDDIMQFISSESNNGNLSDFLIENGELQKQINRLQKIKDEMKIDIDSAIARDELLRSRNTAISSHQLFILDRPLRKGIIPYLWVLSILFIGVGLVVFRVAFPNIELPSPSTTSSTSFISMILELVTNKIVLGSLLVSALIVILFLALKIAGIFGN